MVLNNMDPGRITFLKEDASEFMKGALSRNESWDIVILDPPKLAPRKKVLHIASGMYRNLNSLAMQYKERWSSHDLFMFGSYDAKWDVLSYSSGCSISGKEKNNRSPGCRSGTQSSH
ncbi:hypothetical protein ACFX14_035933 [Malus domestica]